MNNISNLILKIYRKLQAENPGRKIEYIEGKFIVGEAESSEHKRAREKLQEAFCDAEINGDE